MSLQLPCLLKLLLCLGQQHIVNGIPIGSGVAVLQGWVGVALQLHQRPLMHLRRLIPGLVLHGRVKISGVGGRIVFVTGN